MKIFVTGIKGQLGHDLAAVLAPGFEVTGGDLPELDITDPRCAAAALEREKPDVIVNAAAYTHVDNCESHQDEARAVNAGAPRLLAQYAEAHRARLVHVSTDYVFDGRRPLPEPYNEDDKPHPGTVYGLTKYEGEMGIRDVTQRYQVVRTAWLYGAHGRNFLKTMLRLALEHPERPLRVVDDQVGCPTWSYRLAEQIRRIIEAGTPGLYHATGQGHATWFALASAFLEAMDVPHRIAPCTTSEYPTPAQRPTNSILDNKRLRDEGILVMGPWREDLTAFVEAHREALLAEARSK